MIMTTDHLYSDQARSMPARSSAGVSARHQTVADAGRWATHYALVLIFFWFGMLKFTDYEASGIAPLVMNSPLVMWLHGALGVAGTAYFLGCFEIATAVLLALRPWKPRLAAIGGAMAVVCFVITLSFLFSTPGVVQAGFDSPLALSVMPGQFLLKDVVLLCVSVWVIGASLQESAMK
jgi:reactive chlorine resistance protein C